MDEVTWINILASEWYHIDTDIDQVGIRRAACRTG